MNLLTVNRPISDSPKKKPSFYKLRLASAASAATSSLTSGKRSVSMDVNFGHNTSATSKGKLRYEDYTNSHKNLNEKKLFGLEFILKYVFRKPAVMD